MMPEPLAIGIESKAKARCRSWMVSRGSNQYGRIPSFTWRPAITLRTRYLCMGGDEPVDAADPRSTMVPAGLPAVSVVTLGIQMDRYLVVEMPAYDVPPEMVSYIIALAESVGGEDEKRIKALVDAGTKPRKTKVALLPVPDLPSEDFSQILRSLDRPLQPVVHMAIQVKVGAGPNAPSVTPDIKTKKGARDPTTHPSHRHQGSRSEDPIGRSRRAVRISCQVHFAQDARNAPARRLPNPEFRGDSAVVGPSGIPVRPPQGCDASPQCLGHYPSSAPRLRPRMPRAGLRCESPHRYIS